MNEVKTDSKGRFIPRIDYGALAAATPNIIRAAHKDELYIDSLASRLSNVIRNPQLQIKYKDDIEAFAQLLYYTLTSIVGAGQTLGEEYCDLVQVDRHMLPASRRRKVLDMILAIGTPFALRSIETVAKSSSRMESLTHILKVLRNLGTCYSYAHRAFFYIYGVYYHVSKRFTGIRYIQLRKLHPVEKATGGYEVLGWLVLLQIIIATYVTLNSPRKTVNDQENASSDSESSEEEDEENDSSFDIPDRLKCTLCLGKRKDATSTPCGHLFCWYCIAEWCQTKEECPLCRQEIKASSLIPCIR